MDVIYVYHCNLVYSFCVELFFNLTLLGEYLMYRFDLPMLQMFTTAVIVLFCLNSWHNCRVLLNYHDHLWSKWYQCNENIPHWFIIWYNKKFAILLFDDFVWVKQTKIYQLVVFWTILIKILLKLFLMVILEPMFWLSYTVKSKFLIKNQFILYEESSSIFYRES